MIERGRDNPKVVPSRFSSSEPYEKYEAHLLPPGIPFRRKWKLQGRACQSMRSPVRHKASQPITARTGFFASLARRKKSASSKIFPDKYPKGLGPNRSYHLPARNGTLTQRHWGPTWAAQELIWKCSPRRSEQTPKENIPDNDELGSLHCSWS